ncbi:deoxyribonuclease IV [Cohnella suwonensis]|uniref:Deoxyribonuclease IV n=1 Tax=Cohnella suwonensis TaxID=696072 RepID=A0ABW0LQL4_9BACL
MIRIGSHVSTRHGYRKAAEYAAHIGGNAFQYFPKNPRAIGVKAFDAADAGKCASWCAERGIVSIAHGPYAVNPAAGGDSAEPMAACTLNDLEIAEACGSLGVVVHFGHYKGADPLQGYKNAISWINDVLSRWRGKALILLENQAGDRGPMGTTPEELAQIRSLVDEPDKVGFCLDSCHLFASGEWQPERWEAFSERAAAVGFWGGVKAVHLNDSRFGSGSLKDRHAPIGEGYIGESGLRDLFATPELGGVPFVLETPAGADGTHGEQVALARRWLEETGEAVR